MEVFVDRKVELQHIDALCQTLQERKQLLRTPVVEVQGVEGIGKTTLLKQVEARCHELHLRSIWVDIEKDPANVAQEIITQVQQYTQGEEASFELSPLSATKVLLEQGPVAMLIDSVDTADSEQLRAIEVFLRDLIDYENLFVVLTSRKILPFQQERSVAKRLITLSLKPLEREHCELYLDQTVAQIGAEERETIIGWMCGYPLAMKVVTQAVSSGLDPRTDQGQSAIFSLITEQVINQKVLANVRPEGREEYRGMLQLFAVPRGFNLILMQDLIETFSPELKRNSSMAYFTLPKEISDATHVLNWSMVYAGFAVDEPIRAIFLLLLKQEQPARYFAIHAFLARTHLTLAQKFSGSDRVRYMRECFYHTACNTVAPSFVEDLDQVLNFILQEPLPTFQQFSEEFSLDKELKEALGSHLGSIQARIDAHQATIHNDLAEE